MKILVIGSGGREHALAHTFKRQGHRVYCIPGNAGTEKMCEKLPEKWLQIDVNQFDQVVQFVQEEGVDLTVSGSENYLEKGIADLFTQANLPFFGPSQKASQIECSKAFAKEFMEKHQIPTARYVKCTDIHQAKLVIDEYFQEWGGVVVKPNGLTAGKGVVVCKTHKEAEDAVSKAMEEKAYGEAGKELIIEECLQGQEVSIMAFCDGKIMVPMIPAQDHKRLYDEGQGPNTGGMGAYTPTPFLSKKLQEEIYHAIIHPTSEALKKEGIDYKGFLYFGIMLTSKGPKVLEYNCRFGDPEAQVLLPLLKSDLFEILHSCCLEKLSTQSIVWEDKAACCVMMVSRGYPKKYATGYVIKGLVNIEESSSIHVYHSGTKVDDLGQLVTNGGRVLAIVCVENSLDQAIQKCYEVVGKISFQGAYYRLDIASEANKKILSLDCVEV